MKNAKLLIISVLVISLLVPTMIVSGSEGDPDESMVLIDMGNGSTYWTEADVSKNNVGDVLKDALDRLDLQYTLQGNSFVIEGKSSVKIGSVSSSWNYYEWDGSVWVLKTLNSSSVYNGQHIALGFYPTYVSPTETPDHMTSWTMARGDAEQTGHQTVDQTVTEKAKSVFEKNYGRSNFVCSIVLVAGDMVFVGAGGGYSASNPDPTLYCYDRFTFDELWSFSYPKGGGYETATGAIYGGYYFMPASNGTLYKIPLSGPGANNEYVGELNIPKTYDHELVGNTYSTGPSSITYDSGVLYFGSSNGYMYCVDPNLNTASGDPKVIWKTAVGGCIYYMNATVSDRLVYVGALNGNLYVFDAVTGQMKASDEVYTIERSGKKYGQVAVPVLVDGKIIVSFSDGNGMNALTGGIAIYEYSNGNLNKLSSTTDVGLSGNFLLPVENEDFKGVYFTSSKVPLGRMDLSGEVETLRDDIGSVKAGLVLVNDEYILFTEYKTGGNLYNVDLEGNTLGKFKHPDTVANYAMSTPTIIDGHIYAGTDGGFYSVEGVLEAEPEPGQQNIPTWAWTLIILVILLVIFVIYYLYLKRTKEVPPKVYISEKLSGMSGHHNDNVSKTKQNKRRLMIVLGIGSIISFLMFLCCLSFGPSGTIPLGDAFSALISAISKHGEDLTYTEIMVYESRLPRAIAAIGVGMGLAIAGAVYQAIIRNPLVDPYIMGVSSGAGTLAVAALVANFTFFGLLEGTDFATPIMAIVGGLTAFFMTMLIAEKAGGTSTNYVLAGVIVGMAFSSLMTIMLVTAQSDKLHGALSWLYGSFANVGWETVWLIFIPALFLSMVPLLWAKELNLVLLGEEQAQQMGLNVRRFNRWMLILASVLTSLCVAFVGIIGFVGLVVPHLCRMILGGDHRLVLPASIVVGAALMLFADLIARMIMVPMELPVGAITILIGVPLFAYLLVKRGRMYNG